jgi:organic radical activating enzyme
MLLPPHLESSVRLNWHISSWCNYSCDYCPVLVFHKRATNGARQPHAFDYYSAEEWVAGFRKFPQRHILLKITGGEPFIDRANLRTVLDGVSALEPYEIAIDTNGSWDPESFREVEKDKIFLNVAFHPHEIQFSVFFKRLRKIRDSGFRVAMVNLVLDPDDIPAFEKIIAALEREKFFVNLSAMQSWGAYASRTTRTGRELELIREYNTPLDLHFKILQPATRGRPCFYPAMSYYVQYDGMVQVFCTGETGHLFEGSLPPLPRQAVPCPYDHCVACNEMYRALADEPLVTTPLSLHTYEEYAREVTAWRRSQRWRRLTRRFLGHGKRLAELRAALEAASSNDQSATLTVLGGPATVSFPDAPAFGAIDAVNGGTLQARSRDRIALSGWAAAQTGPVREVRIDVAGKTLGTVRDFEPRPEIATRFGRSDLLKTGWRTMVYLPALPPGEYSLDASAYTPAGASAPLAGLRLSIIE